jgi:hypothetical protein
MLAARSNRGYDGGVSEELIGLLLRESLKGVEIELVANCFKSLIENVEELSGAWLR